LTEDERRVVSAVLDNGHQMRTATFESKHRLAFFGSLPISVQSP
jgi:hypothetical protein